VTVDLVDWVWSAMRDGEFYSPSDLANSSGQPIHAVVRVLEFLGRYGFADQVTRRELIFRKVADAPAPGAALRILQAMIEDASAGSAERVASVAGPQKRLNRL